MKIVLTLLFIFANLAHANNPFFNIKEDGSYLIRKHHERRLDDFYQKHEKQILNAAFQEALVFKRGQDFCVANVMTRISHSLKKRGIKASSKKGRETLLIAARDLGHLDDLSLFILKSIEEKKVRLPLVNSGHLKKSEKEKKSEIEAAFKKWQKGRERGECAEVGYRALYNTVNKLVSKKNRRLSNGKFKRLLRFSLKQKIINKQDFKSLLFLIKNNAHEIPISLKEYADKLGSLRRLHPGAKTKTLHSIVTEKVKKERLSNRQYLFTNFDYIEIGEMADLIKHLKIWVDSDDIKIQITPKDGHEYPPVELLPGDRWRFSIRYLRVRMSQLRNSSIFGGKSPRFKDYVTAAFELGVLSEKEIVEIAKLEEIWNPTPTTWQKISKWLFPVARIGSAFVPPPYNFIVALGIGLVETFSVPKDNEKEEGEDKIHRLFVI